MDWLAFIASVVKSLAWPTVALILGLVFRKGIRDIIPLLRKLKAGPIEAEFESQARVVKELATDIQADVPVFSQGNPRVKAPPVSETMRDDVTAFVDEPVAAILEAWRDIDGALFALGRETGDLVDPVTSTRKVYSWATASGKLDSETLYLLRELRDMRNKVAHREVEPTAEATKNYLIAARALVARINSSLEALQAAKKT